MTLYLPDANVLIRAHADYYPVDRIEPFWVWLLEQAEAGLVKMPKEIFDEVAGSKDLLGQWLQRLDVKRAIVLAESLDGAYLRLVVARGYSPDLTDVERNRRLVITFRLWASAEHATLVAIGGVGNERAV